MMYVCLHHLKFFANLKLIYICAYILNQKVEERNIRKESVGKRKEKESDQMLLTAIKERGIQIEGTGEDCISLTGSTEEEHTSPKHVVGEPLAQSLSSSSSHLLYRFFNSMF
jgi:hypothetical protein